MTPEAGMVAVPRLRLEGLDWYAVQTQPRKEFFAVSNLERAGVEVFCPRYRQKVILHGYRREVVRPLFPGYLFAAFDRERSLRLVRYARGVRDVVSFGGVPATVPVELLEEVVRRMEGGFVRLDPPELRPGQRVEITSGPFRGFTGLFQAHLKGRERVAILLETLQYHARLVLDRYAVRAIP